MDSSTWAQRQMAADRAEKDLQMYMAAMAQQVAQGALDEAAGEWRIVALTVVAIRFNMIQSYPQMGTPLINSTYS